ncbi:hypothetical protein FGO68_gene7417 [Halteria grandinella]|uniref:TLDc domain-containing protein n=1 Tax=Halteria grandinella TaxID=5974 RepID=A0A8J8NIW5_HALGN|nr:hypothetical protein FGO68_gene7417 [Halteria grandinella]
MEQVNDDEEVQPAKYRLGRIKSKYLIILIICSSDHLENCIPQFSKSCQTFKQLYQEEGMYVLRNGLFTWQKYALPKESSALIKTIQDIDLICFGLKGQRFKLEKLFDSCQDGDDPFMFHEKCEGIPHTLCVLKTDSDQIIGGFTSGFWGGSLYSRFQTDQTAFLFSLTKQSLHPIQPGQEEYAIFPKSYYFCIFGKCDLVIGQMYSQSCIGYTYQLPEGVEKGSKEAKSYLPGAEVFQHLAIEAYKVVFY